MSHPALDAFGDLEAAALDAHVVGCDRCRRELREQQEVRAILASLPDPGPVPPDVAARIDATLRDLAAGAGARATAGATPGATVVPLNQAPSARRRRPLLVAAAAAVVLLGGAGYGLSQVLAGGSAATTAATAATSGRPEAADRGAGGPQTTAPGTVASGTDYSRERLQSQIEQVLRANRQAAAGPGAGSLSAPTAVAACVKALGAEGSTPILIDLARFEGSPAAVVVLEVGGVREVWVVAMSCGPGQDGTRYFARLP